MKRHIIAGIVALTVAAATAHAQQTYNEMEHLTVNENVTTVITASEPILLTDISTPLVAGDSPVSNILRLKPKEGMHEDGEVLAVVTIVTERYRAQYALIYTTRLTEAVTDKEILRRERTAFDNPRVSMSTADMAQFARRIWNSPARFNNVKTRSNRMQMRLNNIYSVGEYFFIDFSVDNRTNIRFDIDELRVRLEDKRIVKAANSQMIEIEPVMVLESAESFTKGYRNVIVLRKMTFPNSKVLRIELTEKQISGRNIGIKIDYEDVLDADSFGKELLDIDRAF